MTPQEINDLMQPMREKLRANFESCFPELQELAKKVAEESDAAQVVLVVPDEYHDMIAREFSSVAKVVKHSDTLKRPEPVMLGVRSGRVDALIIDDLDNGLVLDNKLTCRWGSEIVKKQRRKAQWKEETQRGGRRK